MARAWPPSGAAERCWAFLRGFSGRCRPFLGAAGRHRCPAGSALRWGWPGLGAPERCWVFFGRVGWFFGRLGGLCASDGLRRLGVHAGGAARGGSRLYKRGAEAPKPASTFFGVSPGVGVAAVPALPPDVPLPLGCTSSFPAAAAYTAAARRGRVVRTTPAGASLVLVLPIFPSPFSLVTPPPATIARGHRPPAETSCQGPCERRACGTGRHPVAGAAKPGQDDCRAPLPGNLPAGGTRGRARQAPRAHQRRRGRPRWGGTHGRPLCGCLDLRGA